MNPDVAIGLLILVAVLAFAVDHAMTRQRFDGLLLHLEDEVARHKSEADRMRGLVGRQVAEHRRISEENKELRRTVAKQEALRATLVETLDDLDRIEVRGA